LSRSERRRWIVGFRSAKAFPFAERKATVDCRLSLRESIPFRGAKGDGGLSAFAPRKHSLSRSERRRWIVGFRSAKAFPFAERKATMKHQATRAVASCRPHSSS